MVLYCNQFSQFSSVARSCPTLCDPMNCSTGLPVHHQLLEFTQTLRFVIIFTQIMHKTHLKNKTLLLSWRSALKSTVVQHNSRHIGVAFSEQARRVTDWRRKTRWRMVELEDRRQYGSEGRLQFHSHLVLMAQVLVSCWIQFYLHS